VYYLGNSTKLLKELVEMIRKLHYMELLLVIFWKADLKCDSGAL
jgi:hypothetical protein